jgi:hypothetical protein
VEAKGRINSVALLRVLRYPADDVMNDLVSEYQQYQEASVSNAEEEYDEEAPFEAEE